MTATTPSRYTPSFFGISYSLSPVYHYFAPNLLRLGLQPGKAFDSALMEANKRTKLPSCVQCPLTRLMALTYRFYFILIKFPN